MKLNNIFCLHFFPVLWKDVSNISWLPPLPFFLFPTCLSIKKFQYDKFCVAWPMALPLCVCCWTRACDGVYVCCWTHGCAGVCGARPKPVPVRVCVCLVFWRACVCCWIRRGVFLDSGRCACWCCWTPASIPVTHAQAIPSLNLNTSLCSHSHTQTYTKHTGHTHTHTA